MYRPSDAGDSPFKNAAAPAEKKAGTFPQYIPQQPTGSQADVRAKGAHVPTLCNHPSLEPNGACRLCTVEVTHPDWNGWSNLVTSCVYPIKAGLQISTQSERVKDNRRTLLEGYSRERGAILVGGSPVATSVPSKDELKFVRTYPSARLYSQLAGYYSFIYGAGGGLEGTEDDILSGQSDKLFYRRMVDLVTGKVPSGASIELTINPKAQQAADKARAKHGGKVLKVTRKGKAYRVKLLKDSGRVVTVTIKD